MFYQASQVPQKSNLCTSIKAQSEYRGDAHMPAQRHATPPAPRFPLAAQKHESTLDFDKQAKPETLDTGSSAPRRDGERDGRHRRT